jgi:nitrogen fixation NifU-like protein
MFPDSHRVYQKLILDHHKNPRNFGELGDATHHAHRHNRLCGDWVTIFIKLDRSEIAMDTSFIGEGCAICMASASLLTQVIRGKNRHQIGELCEMFPQFLTNKTAVDSADKQTTCSDRVALPEDLHPFHCLVHYPARIQCATLAWQTLQDALKSNNSEMT